MSDGEYLDGFAVVNQSGRSSIKLVGCSVVDDLAKNSLTFHPGKLRAEAQMHPGAERDMPGGVALGVEGVGIGELTWVAVGRAPCQQHARTLRDDGGPDVIIDPRCAIEALDGDANRSCSSMAEPMRSGRCLSNSSWSGRCASVRNNVLNMFVVVSLPASSSSTAMKNISS